MSPVSRRKKTKPVYLGGVQIGGEAPIVVQSMTSSDTRDVSATVQQIRELEDVGCEIVRVAVPDETAAAAIHEIKDQIHIPLIADIHFSPQLALLAMRHGADGIRINPGNILPDGIRKIVLYKKNENPPLLKNKRTLMIRDSLSCIDNPCCSAYLPRQQ
ncbi:MAG: flavodoxin-dependent (E)-4-hydroxy-3-methylbut-2-enyl-diphosphate synthase, partial [Deltaproteobacteria bacterium]|nr:flavodoxin-dependent (E)-4-hydroxy-3-methylbut-2-enyl-diphosphate synthase [Deltaproteobacteria bacterium]